MIATIVIIISVLALISWSFFTKYTEPHRSLVRKLETVPWNDIDDGDGLPENQWDLYVAKGEKIIKTRNAIYTDIWNGPGIQVVEKARREQDLGSLFWVFVRRYGQEEQDRDRMLAHFDSTTVSILVPLSDPSSYDGGELVVLADAKERLKFSIEENTEYLSQLLDRGDPDVRLYKNKIGIPIPILGFNSGIPDLHMVLPVTSGRRYVLCAFYK